MLNERSYMNYEDNIAILKILLLTVTGSPLDTKVNSTLAASPISGSLVIIVCTRVPTAVNYIYTHATFYSYNWLVIANSSSYLSCLATSHKLMFTVFSTVGGLSLTSKIFTSIVTFPCM